MIVRLMLLSALTATAAAQACPAKTYEFASIRLTHDAKLIKNSDKLSLDEGDQLDLNAGAAPDKTSLRLSVKLLSHQLPNGNEKNETSVYSVTETVMQHECVYSTESKSYKVTISHVPGTRNMDTSAGCGELIKEETGVSGSVSSFTSESAPSTSFNVDDCRTPNLR